MLSQISCISCDFCLPLFPSALKYEMGGGGGGDDDITIYLDFMIGHYWY